MNHLFNRLRSFSESDFMFAPQLLYSTLYDQLTLYFIMKAFVEDFLEGVPDSFSQCSI